MALSSLEPICVQDFERYLREGTGRAFWQFYRSGADDEQTLDDNVQAFRRYRLRPRFLRDVSQRDTSCRVLGHRLPFPVGVSPTAQHAFAHRDGEVETAKGVSSTGTAIVLSMWSNNTLEAVAQAVGSDTPLFHQLNLLPDRTKMAAILGRIERAGFKALFVTIDQPLIGHRLQFKRRPIKPHEYAPIPNLVETGQEITPDTIRATQKPSATWDDVAWLKRMTSLPVVVKGVLTAETAKEAVSHGVAGILVSNHGGRQLDGVPATIDALAEVVEAVGGSGVEVYLDGGIRRGTDVLKALALGARAVFIGRPALWGLAYDGARGVTKVLDILKDEFSLAMALSGCVSISDITPDLIARPSCCKL